MKRNIIKKTTSLLCACINKIKPFVALFIVIALLVCSPAVCIASNGKENVNITIEQTEYEYTPDGIEVKFTCSPPKYASSAVIEIENAVSSGEKITVAEGKKAILHVGSYTVNINISEGNKNAAASSRATIKVVPAAVSIVTPYNKSAYSDMDNIPEYYLQPEWASELITLETEYFSISDLSQKEYTKVDAPKEIGLYFVKIKPKYTSTDIKCYTKQFVYEIAVNFGNKLSDEEAARAVPSWFSASLKNIVVPYSGESVTAEYTVNPALTECEIKYRLLSYNDTTNEYTSTPPTEPGDYQAACFASGVIIGDGSISIEKLDCSIKLEDCEVSYDPAGFTPKPVSVEPENLKVKYIAYAVDDSDISTMEEIPLPIKKCGRFLIVASPEDSTHYRSDDTFAYYTINKTVPTFDEKTQYFEFDNKPHAVRIGSLPEWVEYDVEYTEIDQKGNVKRNLGAEAPVEKGRYMASIIVKSSDTVAESTAFIEMKITTGAKKLQAREQNGEKELMGDIGIKSILAIAIPLIAIIGLSIYFFVKSKKV